MIYQVVYVSSATELLTLEALARLLFQSRHNNATHEITGMLLYHKGTFMQAFEGPPAATAQLWQNIQDDARHAGIITLYEGPIEARHFSDWTMGFRGGEEIVHADPGFHSLGHAEMAPALREAAVGRARTLLMSFGRHLTR